MSQTPDPWLSTAEACEYLQCGPSFLRSECRRMRIKHQELGRRYRFKKSWLDTWKEAHIKGGEPETKGPGFGATSSSGG